MADVCSRHKARGKDYRKLRKNKNCSRRDLDFEARLKKQTVVVTVQLTEMSAYCSRRLITPTMGCLSSMSLSKWASQTFYISYWRDHNLLDGLRGTKVHVIRQHRKPLVALLAVLLVSVLLVRHSHDGIVSDTACVECLHKANLDSVINNTSPLPNVVVTRVYADHFHRSFVQLSCVLAVVQSPPTFLIG